MSRESRDYVLPREFQFLCATILPSHTRSSLGCKALPNLAVFAKTGEFGNASVQLVWNHAANLFKSFPRTFTTLNAIQSTSDSSNSSILPVGTHFSPVKNSCNAFQPLV